MRHLAPRYLRFGMAAGALVCVSVLVRAQSTSPQLPTAIPSVRFNSGQNIAPYFEGWIKNADGTFDLVFGYFNRNYQEEVAIAPGPENRVEPGNPDQGQPTYFLPRRQRWVFRVRVPADFGKKTLTWTLTAHGRTDKAYGELLPVQEITERIIMTNGGLDPGEDDPNKPPAISIASGGSITATTGTPLTLTANVADDGLPKPRVPAAPRPTAPAPTGSQGNFGAQVNSSGAAPRFRGLAVTWMELRGPAKVTFDPAGAIPVANSQAVTHARFTAPGTYKLVATANDGALSRKTELTVTVRE